MIDLSKLISSETDPNSIRYAKDCSNTRTGVRHGMGPVVAWNITQRCNFKCSHCYSSAYTGSREDELTYEQMTVIVDQMKAMNVPVILLSGGEPMMKDCFFDIVTYIREAGIKVSLSTNGSLITEEKAQQLKNLGISYVGISLDGTETVNDEFRGVTGAFKMTLKGIENCHKVGQKVGLRMTINKKNVKEVPAILDLMEAHEVHRICFYHLVPSGRGSEIKDLILTSEETRDFMDGLIKYTEDALARGLKKEILTVTNHADGPYLYLNYQEKNPELAQNIYGQLSNNKGNRSGIALMNMDWHGNVYPDQFSKHQCLGNAVSTPLTDIWVTESETLKALRNKREHITGRCADCRWLDICGGNLRARAYHMTGDQWASDPGCYLEDSEI